MGKRRRRLLVLFLAASVGILVIVVRHYLSSAYVAGRLATQLTEVTGGLVEVDTASIGLEGTRGSGVRFFEPGADSPWLSVDSLQADVTLWDVLRGTTMPRDLLVRGADLTLRFDRTRKLLTRLPDGKSTGAALPRIRLEAARLTLRQEGRNDAVFSGIDVEVDSAAGSLALSGTVSDPYWGDWSARGQFDPGNGQRFLHLQTAQTRVTQEKLENIPFVSARVWKEVQAEGTAAAAFELRFEPKLHYRVTLRPTAITARIAVLDLDLEATAGDIIVDDHMVHLRGLSGRTADGTIAATGTLDFTRASMPMGFRIRAEGLDVHRLPRSWALPTALEGRLSGQADLRLAFRAGQLRTSGRGDGVLAPARIAGQDASPIRLQLLPEGAGFTFVVDPPESQAWVLAQLVVQAHVGVLRLLDPFRSLVRTSGWPALVDFPSTLEVRVRLDDVALEDLARRLKVALPLAGRLFVEARLSIPLDALHDTRRYRLRGQLQVPRLRLAGLTLERVRARLFVDEGVLHVSDIQAMLAGAALKGAGEVHLDTPFRYRGSLTYRADDLAALQRLAPRPFDTVKIAGSVSATAELSGTLQPATVRATGTALLADVVLNGAAAGSLRFRWDADPERLRADARRSDFLGGNLTASVLLPWDAATPGSVDLGLENFDAGLAGELAPKWLRLEGRASAILHGSIARDFSARLEVEAPRLSVRGIPVERLRGAFDISPRRLDYRLQAAALGGGIHCEGKAPLVKDGPDLEGRLRLERIRIERAWRPLGLSPLLGSLAGSLTLDLVYDQDAEMDLAGSGRFVLDRLRWQGARWPGQVQGSVRLTPGMLRIVDLTGNPGQGRLRGAVFVNLRQPERSGFFLSLEGAELADLLDPEDARGVASIQGPFDAHVRGSLGHEWRGHGTVRLARGKVLGIEVSDWQLPYTYSFVPAQGAGQLEIRDSRAQVALGRVTGEATLSWGAGTQLRGGLRFVGVDLRQLLLELADLRQVAGLATGRLDFSAANLRSRDDLVASLEASLQQVRAQEVPVLRQLAPFLSPGRSFAAPFHAGNVRARLAGGIIRLESLTLSSSLVELFFSGMITLSERLDLQVVARTGGSPVNARALGLLIPATGPLPTALLLQASRVLSNRLLSFHVHGTLRHPTVRLQPLPMLAEEVLRFFLSGASLLGN